MPNPNPGPQNLQWLQWRDFTPGIVTRTGALASSGPAPANLGAATLSNTYRCVCLPQGGLTPLPARTFNRSIGTQNSGTNVTTGATVIGPIVEYQNRALPNVYPRSTSLHQAYAFTAIGGMTTALVPNGAWTLTAHVLDANSTKSLQVLRTSTQTPVAHWSPVPMLPHSIYNTTGATITRTVVFSWGEVTSTSAATTETSLVPPSTNSASTTPVALISAGNTALNLAIHQARVLRSFLTMGGTGGAGIGTFLDTGEIPPGGMIDFTLPNSVTLDSASPFVPDTANLSGVGVIASLTASDLLIIYQSGGAVIVQGDIANPVVRRLPNVPSTNGMQMMGTSTPLGYIYLQNRGGAYLWQGGDSAQLISPQLDDDFWYVTNSDIVQQYAGELTFWRDYVLFPNNWLWDTKTQSWWQIELPSTLTYWLWKVNPLTNMLYGFVFSYSQNATNISGWSPVTQATNYSWQSQPFYPAEDRQVQGMEMVLVAQGAGTVTFTVTALDTGDTDTIAITTTGTNPKYYRENMNGMSGATMQIRVVADGGSSPAPTIHEFRLGYLTGYPVPAP